MSTLKGAPKIKQKIADRIDPNRKHRGDKRNPFQKSDPLKAILPREEGVGGPPPKVSEETEACLFFLNENIDKDHSDICESLKTFIHKNRLVEFVNHLIFVGLSGWREEDGKLIHESGHTASRDNWNLLEDGRLATKGGKHRQLDIEKLYKFLEVCDG